jgi:hypothetical protein
MYLLLIYKNLRLVFCEEPIGFTPYCSIIISGKLPSIKTPVDMIKVTTILKRTLFISFTIWGNATDSFY